MKNKKPETVRSALQDWVKQTSVKGVLSDNGGEWQGVVKAFFKDRGIEQKLLDSAYSKTSTGVVERFIRTLRMKLREYWIKNNNLVWLPYLDSVIKEYNHTIHSRMRMKPVDVFHSQEPKFTRTATNIELAKFAFSY